MEVAEPSSMETILASELYPKLPLTCDDPGLILPFSPLCGESALYLGRTADGVIALSNFRLFIRHQQNLSVNVPLGLIDTIECRDIFFLYVYCKDARSIRCVFSTNEGCLEWYKRLSRALDSPRKLQDVFAFAFHAWCVDECSGNRDAESCAQLCQPGETSGYSFGREVERLGFDLKSSWRICYVNEDFKVCQSYPQLHLVPASITDSDIESVANFRSSRRFPSVVWRDSRTGAVIARSSQPEVGWLGWRNSEDEHLLQAMAAACLSTPSSSPPSTPPTNGHANGDISSVSHGSGVKKMLIVDARSYAAAVANRAKGGGCECQEYYPNCEIQFMSLANIHAIRKSFQALRALCAAAPDQASWLSGLENAKWLHHMGGLMRAAVMVVNAIDMESRPVLVHCSDGWDRTPQIVALAEILLDPYYRTIEGFQVLVEREWLDFGHKFSDRCGLGMHSDDTNERCPVFLQFLDCIHQLVKQFPCAFQFNEAFLVKLVQHTYSCLFGNFLCNSAYDRQQEKVNEQTSNVWALLRPSSAKFRNYLYTPALYQVLRPSCNLRHMYFWSAVYLSEEAPMIGATPEDASPDSSKSGETNEAPEETTLIPKTRSCDDIVAAVEAASDIPSGLTRRLSDPHIATDPNCLLKQAAIQNGEKLKQNGECDDDDNNETKDKRISMNSDIVRFTNTASMTDVLLDSEPEEKVLCNGHSNHNGVIKNGEVEHPLENGTTSDNDNAEEEGNSFQHQPKQSKSVETVILSTSTDTLTEEGGVIEETVNRNEKNVAAVKCHRNSCKPLTLVDCCSSSSNAVQNGCLEPQRTCGQEAQTMPLEKSSSISTSTSEISDSQINLHRSVLMHNQLRLGMQMVEAAALSGIPSSRTSNSSVESESATPPQALSRTPGSCSPPTPGTDKSCWQWSFRQGGGYTQQLDVDGLTTWVEAGQARLAQMEADYQARIDMLQRQLVLAKHALYHYTTNASGAAPHAPDVKDENGSQAESQESEHISLGGSDLSWEQVEERDARMTLWVPDHAVTHCAGCDQEFWIVRRRHHCRSCGRVFCGECTSFAIPVPNQQLNSPVRVCRTCFSTICSDDHSISGASQDSIENDKTLTSCTA